MEKTRKIRCFTTFIILIILIIILLIMNVCIGTVHISFKAAFATLYDHHTHSTNHSYLSLNRYFMPLSGAPVIIECISSIIYPMDIDC